LACSDRRKQDQTRFRGMCNRVGPPFGVPSRFAGRLVAMLCQNRLKAGHQTNASTQSNHRERSVARPGRRQFASNYFNFMRRPFTEQPLFERLRPGGQIPDVSRPRIFQAAQGGMAREILLARFGTKLADSGFNLPLQIHQPPSPIIDTHPDDSGRAGIGEKADTLGAQGQGPGILANSAGRFLQIFDAIRRDIAQEPEREMKLIRPGPAGHVARHERLQFLLDADDFIPDRLRDGNCHKQPERGG